MNPASNQYDTPPHQNPNTPSYNPNQPQPVPPTPESALTATTRSSSRSSSSTPQPQPVPPVRPIGRSNRSSRTPSWEHPISPSPAEPEPETADETASSSSHNLDFEPEYHSLDEDDPSSVSAMPFSNDLTVETTDSDGVKTTVEKKTSSTGSASAMQAAITYIARLFPDGLASDGSNWDRWSAAVRRAASTLDDDVFDVFSGVAKKEEFALDAKEKVRYERAANRVFMFVTQAAGPASDAFEDVEGGVIFTRLEERYGSAATTAERYSDYAELSETKLVDVDALADHFDLLKKAKRKFNDRVKQHRVAKGLPNKDSPAIAEDVFLMVYSMSLTDDLRRIVFLHFNEEDDVEALHKSLTTYLRNERLSSTTRESAFAAREGSRRFPSTPVRSSTPSRFTPTPSRRNPSGPTFNAPALTNSSPHRSSHPSSTTTPRPAQQRWYSSADQVPGAEKWGLFRRKDGNVRFRAPQGACYDCWETGHFANSMECPVAGDVKKKGEAKSKKLSEVGIAITPANAAALVSFEIEERRAVEGAEDPSNEEYWLGGLSAKALFASPEDPSSFTDSPFFAHLTPSDGDVSAGPTANAGRALVTNVGRSFASMEVIPHIEPTESAHGFVTRITRKKASKGSKVSSRVSLLSRISRSASKLKSVSTSISSRFVTTIEGSSLLGRVLPSSLLARVSRVLAAAPSTSKDDSTYIFDTGASIHLTDDRSTLHDYETLPPHRQVSIGGAFGGAGKAVGRGSLIGEFTLPDGSLSRIRFTGVYYAPKLGHKLLSGYQIIASGYKVEATQDDVRIYNKSKKLIAVLPVSKAQAAILVEISRCGTSGAVM